MKILKVTGKETSALITVQFSGEDFAQLIRVTSLARAVSLESPNLATNETISIVGSFYEKLKNIEVA